MTRPAPAPTSGRSVSRPWLPFVVLIAALASPVAAVAQSSADLQQLLNRLNRVERDVQTLSSQVFRGQVPSGAAAPSSDFPGSYATQVEVRLQEVERQLQMLTGRVEEIGFANEQLSQRLDRALNDVEFRLSTLEGGAPTESGGAAASVPSMPDVAAGGAASASDAPSGDDVAPAAPGTASTMGTLGTLSTDSGGSPTTATAAVTPPSDPQPPASTQPVALPEGPVERQYEFAYNQLAQGDYLRAEQALQQFLEAHQDHALASNAQYWLGETFYIRGRFNDAAVAFAKGYQNYPDGSKAVDSLLKLGMSLSAMGQTEDACLTFSQLQTEFPDAPAGIARRAVQERDRLQCG